MRKQQAIFGPNGYFARILDALDGAVTYVPGNHDMGVTATQVAQVVSSGGHRMRFAEGTYYPLGVDHSIALAHGHATTMFNAPDWSTSWAPLPIGYFVTRMFATKWARDLKAGRTVADLPNQGSPNSVNYVDVIWDLVASGGSIADGLLDWVATQTGISYDQVFRLPGNRTVALTEAAGAYADLFSNWARAQGDGTGGEFYAMISALSDTSDFAMGWFAQRQAVLSNAEVVVFGHTHSPIAALAGDFVQYNNSGFECLSVPDTEPLGTQSITFTVVDSEAKTCELMQAVASDAVIRVLPLANAPTTNIIPATYHDVSVYDLSVYVTIFNGGEDEMTLDSCFAEDGIFSGPVPSSIAPGQTVKFWLANLWDGLAGTDGSVSYSTPSGRPSNVFFRYTYAQKWMDENAATGGDSFQSWTGSGPWMPGPNVAHGYPLYVAYTANGATPLG